MRSSGFLICARWLVAAWGAVCPVAAAPVAVPEALEMVRGWLATTKRPLEAALGQLDRQGVQAFSDAQGQALGYLIPLQPEGFIITSADTEVEPIIAFSANGYFQPGADNPLQSVLAQDLAARLRLVRPQPQGSAGGPPRSAAAKWARLTRRAAALQSSDGDEPDDLRVAPFILSRWNQSTIWNGSANVACYNYYTPPYQPGASSNYVAGCTATAWAQILRYFQYPTAGVGTAAFPIRVDGTNVLRQLRGGDGQGGPYAWDLMPYVPGAGTTEAERQAVGALLADLGATTATAYSASDSTSTVGATMLTNVFHLANVIVDGGTNVRFKDEVNANLDARLPVCLNISGKGNQHVVVCDGYGFNLGAAYHHLNLGWGGLFDAWCNLPQVGTSYGFDTVSLCYYNLYTNGTGEIVSGRVIGLDQKPVSDALVQLVGGGVEQADVTDAYGIYAFPRLPSNTSFQITAAKGTRQFPPQWVTTGQSMAGGSVGNRWALNFTEVSQLSTCLVWGIIRRVDGQGVGGITVQFSDGSEVTTDAWGRFAQSMTAGWTGTLTPVLTAYDVVPASRSLVNVLTNIGDQDFVVQLVTISGAVRRPDSRGLAGVLVEFSDGGGQATTDNTGGFTTPVRVGWSGTIRPVWSTFNFEPAWRDLTNVVQDVAGQDFVSQFVTVSGTVTGPDGAVLAGARVLFSNEGGEATTDWRGYFENTVRLGWSGTITPRQLNVSFTPSLRAFTNLVMDLMQQDFDGRWQKRLTVDARAGGANDGTSWGNAFTNLQAALALARPGEEVWVAQGSYYPGEDPAVSFQCPPGALIYGGFSGQESTMEERNWQAHPTILSGDLGIVGNNLDNSYHVVTGAKGVRLDGFTITGGNAGAPGNEFNPYGGGVWADNTVTDFTAANCILADNAAVWGGAGYNVRLLNCVVRHNTAEIGGGVYKSRLNACFLMDNTANSSGGGGAESSLTACILSTNSATQGGGAYSCWLTNCLLAANSATEGGGAWGCWLYSSTVVNNSASGAGGGLYWGTAMNSIVHFNSSGDSNDNYLSTFLSYSCTFPSPIFPNNLTNDPVFLDAARGDYRLATNSPCVDRGLNQPWMTSSRDLAGQPRVIHGTVDLGAYETPQVGPPLTLIRTQGTFQLRLFTAPGVVYRVEYKNTLQEPGWRFLGQVVGDGLQDTFLDADPPAPQRFYRVRLE